jgi:hypothetical protein
MHPPGPIQSELEAAHARCEWQVGIEVVESRLAVCRQCGEFLRHGCPRWPKVRVFISRLVHAEGGCENWP